MMFDVFSDLFRFRIFLKILDLVAFRAAINNTAAATAPAAAVADVVVAAATAVAATTLAAAVTTLHEIANGIS